MGNARPAPAHGPHCHLWAGRRGGGGLPPREASAHRRLPDHRGPVRSARLRAHPRYALGGVARGSWSRPAVVHGGHRGLGPAAGPPAGVSAGGRWPAGGNHARRRRCPGADAGRALAGRDLHGHAARAQQHRHRPATPGRSRRARQPARSSRARHPDLPGPVHRSHDAADSPAGWWRGRRTGDGAGRRARDRVRGLGDHSRALRRAVDPSPGRRDQTARSLSPRGHPHLPGHRVGLVARGAVAGARRIHRGSHRQRIGVQPPGTRRDSPAA